MKILFDQGTPAPLRHALTGHTVSTALELGWESLENGRLLAAAESSFDAFITTDKNIRCQQNLFGRRLAILVLPTTSWPEIRACLNMVSNAVNELNPGNVVELRF